MHGHIDWADNDTLVACGATIFLDDQRHAPPPAKNDLEAVQRFASGWCQMRTRGFIRIPVGRKSEGESPTRRFATIAAIRTGEFGMNGVEENVHRPCQRASSRALAYAWCALAATADFWTTSMLGTDNKVTPDCQPFKEVFLTASLSVASRGSGTTEKVDLQSAHSTSFIPFSRTFSEPQSGHL
jgi:hypothetical protein